MKSVRPLFVALWIAGLSFPLESGAVETVRRRAVTRPAVVLTPEIVTIADDFRGGMEGWSTGFADYSPVNMYMELESGLRPIPEELGVAGTGLLIAGHNRSDDLFMFLKKELRPFHGIVPDQPYEVHFVITFASNVGPECGGIGGSPGLSVYLKAGASDMEPRVVLDESDDHYRMTVDKGNQSVGGPAASVAGNIAKASPGCSENAPWEIVTRVHRHTEAVMSNDEGELWLLVGTDSGFEGKTTLYYLSIEVLLIPLAEQGTGL